MLNSLLPHLLVEVRGAWSLNQFSDGVRPVQTAISNRVCCFEKATKALSDVAQGTDCQQVN